MGVSFNLRLHAKQGQAFQTRGTEVLFGGAAGGGKSFLFRAAAITWCMAIPGLQVYLFRRTYPDLQKNHMMGTGSFPDLVAPLVLAGMAKIVENEIRFYNGPAGAVGSRVILCHCQHEKNIYDYQGAEIHVLMIDELTQWPASMYKYLRGRTRLGGLKIPAQYADVFPRILCGANPGGIGHNWVRKAWIADAAPLELRQMPQSEGGMTRQYIPARLEDNPTLVANDPGYEKRLEGLGSAALVRAMRLGDWNIVAGGALDDVWGDGSGIIVPRFKVPTSWRVDRSFDWGSAKPFSVLWWSQSDGTEATLPDGRKFCPPRGSLVLAHEWYGAKAENEGLMMSPRDIAKGIVERETSLVSGGHFHSTPRPGPADNQIRNVSQPGTPTIAQEMETAGVRWMESDKAPGTRKIGLELMRSRLREAAKEHPEGPGLYVMDHCRGAISRWPVLPRDEKDPDDVDSNAEDHDYDAARYRILGPKPILSSVKPLNL